MTSSIPDPVFTLAEDLVWTGVRPNRKKGQNYLISPTSRDRILESADVSDADRVLEIGPGTGILTWGLIPRVRELIAVETEPAMVRLLNERFQGIGHFRVICGNGLDAMHDLLRDSPVQPMKIVSNLPYSITSPLLMTMCSLADYYSNGTLLLQKDLVDRVTAAPGDRERGALSVLVQSRFEVRCAFRVKATHFRPKPSVESAVLVMRRRPDRFGSCWSHFLHVVLTCFQQRRKTILNNLRAVCPHGCAERLLKDSGIDPGLRPQQLDEDAFLIITRFLAENHLLSSTGV
ncbi:ribosomal RNA small subunit methyltransferase A [bacterium]|nr:ribosomal RNA small subunit methyltransferase A [candidate division CSSED10-310 bacterium]